VVAYTFAPLDLFLSPSVGIFFLLKGLFFIKRSVLKIRFSLKSLQRFFKLSEKKNVRIGPKFHMPHFVSNDVKRSNSLFKTIAFLDEIKQAKVLL